MAGIILPGAHTHRRNFNVKNVFTIAFNVSDNHLEDNRLVIAIMSPQILQQSHSI